MSRQEEQQIINDAPVILETILSEYGEVNAIAEVQRLVNIAKSAIQRAEAAERDASDVRRWADSVPVESIYYVWLAAVAHSRDNGNYASKDVIAVDIWLAAQHVKPWEVQPCPKCKGTGYRYNRYGEMAECMDCDARGEVQP